MVSWALASRSPSHICLDMLYSPLFSPSCQKTAQGEQKSKLISRALGKGQLHDTIVNQTTIALVVYLAVAE